MWTFENHKILIYISTLHSFKTAEWNGATRKNENCWQAAGRGIKLCPTKTTRIPTCPTLKQIDNLQSPRHHQFRRTTTTRSRRSISKCAAWGLRRISRTKRRRLIKSFWWKSQRTWNTKLMRWIHVRRYRHLLECIRQSVNYLTTSTTTNRRTAVSKPTAARTTTMMNTIRMTQTTAKKSMSRDFPDRDFPRIKYPIEVSTNFFVVILRHS